MKVIILAAGFGARLRPYTDDRPKAMVGVHGKPIIHWQREAFKRAGIERIVVVKGYKPETIDDTLFSSVYQNIDFAVTNMVASLWCAEAELHNDVIVSYGDIIFEDCVLDTLIQSSHPISIVVDENWKPYWMKRFGNNLLDDAESLMIGEDGYIKSIGQKVSDVSSIQGQYIGMMRFKEEGIRQLRSCYQTLKDSMQSGKHPLAAKKTFQNIYMTDLLHEMINSNMKLFPVPIQGGWMEIDNIRDYELANELVHVETNCLKIDR